MRFIQKQVSEILEEIANGENGYQQILKLGLEDIMRALRSEFNQIQEDSSNGYRFSVSIGSLRKVRIDGSPKQASQLLSYDFSAH